VDDAERREWREKMLSIGIVTGRPRPREYRDGNVAVKEVTDHAGNILTYRSDYPDGAPGVEIRPRTVTMADGRVLTHHEG
jgi:hypothetical protein